MIIIVVVQSATKAGAFFGAGWQEKWLMARLTEQGVELRAKEQKWAEGKMINVNKSKYVHKRGQPIVKEGMKTIRPTHRETKVKIFHQILHTFIIIRSFQDQNVYSAFVYSISLKEEPVYIGSSTRYRLRRREHAGNIFKEEKHDFVMRILYKVQSVKPAAAIFLAESLESWLQAYAVESGVTLRGEQKHLKGFLFHTPRQTRAFDRDSEREKRKNPEFVADEKAKRLVRVKLHPGILIKARKLKNADRQSDRESGVRYPCTTCMRSYSRKDILTTHVKEAHSNKGIRVRYPCTTCEKSYFHKRDLTTHVKEAHPNNGIGARYLCTTCMRSYSRKDILTTHVKEAHLNNGIRARYPCTTCEKSYMSKRELARHDKNAHPNNGIGVRYTCTTCMSSYIHKRHLTTHVKEAHPNNGASVRYLCIECGKSYIHKRDLTKHDKNAHPNNGARATYPCKKCEKSYMNKESLARHVKAKHSEWKQ